MIETDTSIWRDFHGHAAQVDMFRRAISRDRLGQSYLFVGPSGIGKFLFARKLATCLVCQNTTDSELEACGNCPACHQMAAGTYPDYYEVGLPPGKNEIPVKAMVGDMDERGRSGLCHDIMLTPMAGSRRIGVIDQVGRLNPVGANAFLKTLEEPPEGALLILIAEQPRDVLPTIRSRCQIVSFQPLAEQDLRQIILAQEIASTAAEASELARMSDGSLEVARRLADPELQEMRKAIWEVFARRPFDASGAGERLAKIAEQAGDTAAQRESTLWMARFLATYFGLVNRSLLGDDTIAPEPSHFGKRLLQATGDESEALELLADLTLRVGDVADQIHLYVQPRICIEALFYDFANRLRREG